MDSFKFMSASLEYRKNNLEKDQFHNVNKVCSGKQRELMLKKSVSHMNIWTACVN